MDAAAKKAWLTALRSGKYEQTQNQLCDLDGHMCCLGVLIDATEDGDWDLLESAFPWENAGYSYQGADGELPDNIRQRLGITESQQERLVAMNDSEGNNFKEIADWIDELL